MGNSLTKPMVITGAPACNADLLYATGFMAPDPIVYIKFGRKKMMVVSQLEWGRAKNDVAGRGISVVTPQHIGLEGEKRRDISAWVKAALSHFGKQSIAVPYDFPHGLAASLKRQGIGVEVLEGAPFPQRRTKQLSEIACIRQSQRAAVIAMRAACTLISESRIDSIGRLRSGETILTSEAVQRRISEVLLSQDCYCGETIVACGVQGADPHERGHGPLKAYEPIVMDIFPRHQKHGYWGDITRTVVKGEPSKDLKRMYAAVKAAQAAALKEIRAGVSGLRIHNAAVSVFEHCGYETSRRPEGFVGFIHSTGHGVGLAIHEAPSLGGEDCRLRVGDVVTVEPGLYYPELGGVRIEDTVVVTREGWNYLAPCEKRFVLK